MDNGPEPDYNAGSSVEIKIIKNLKILLHSVSSNGFVRRGKSKVVSPLVRRGSSTPPDELIRGKQTVEGFLNF